MNVLYLGLSLLGAMWVLALVVFIHARRAARRPEVEVTAAAPPRRRSRITLIVAVVILALAVVPIPLMSRSYARRSLTALNLSRSNLSEGIAAKRAKLRTLNRRLSVTLSEKVPVGGLTASQAREVDNINELKRDLLVVAQSPDWTREQAAVARQDISDLDEALKESRGFRKVNEEQAAVEERQIKSLESASLLRGEIDAGNAGLANLDEETAEMKEQIKREEAEREATERRRNNFIYGAILLVTMVVGTGCKTIWDWTEARKQGGATPPDVLSCIQPLLVSPIVFGAVMYGVMGRDEAVQLNIMTFVFAFQNGFMWRTILDRRTASF